MKTEIEKLIYEGFGIGHDDTGKAIFVRKCVPGDILDIKVVKDKAKYSEGIINKIIHPSLKRINPPCPYFEECGGCEHQNIAYEDQLKYKEEIFKEILSRAKINTNIEPMIAGSKEPFFYRNSIRFDFIQNSDGSISFARHNQIYDSGFIKVEKCLLQSELSNEILSVLKEFINHNIENKKSFWQIKLREGKFTNEMMVELITSGDDLPAKNDLVEILKQFPEVKSIYHTIAKNKSLKNLTRRLIFGSPIIHEKIGRYTFQISPESFFQTNSLGVHTLYDKIKEYSEIKMGDNVLDLYCGTGTIGIYLSVLARKVVGVESVQKAINDASDNAKINKIHNIEFTCADAEKFLRHPKFSPGTQSYFGATTDKFNIIIVDPPRAGLSKKIIFEICHLKFEIIIYVSCNPATFARDIKEFEKNGLKLVKVQPIDMFPQTHHIECVGVLK